MGNQKKKYSLLDVIGISFKASFSSSIIISAQTFISAIFPTIQIMVTAWFIDEATQIVLNKADIKNALIPILCIVLLTAYQWGINSIMKLVWIKLESRLRESFSVDIIKKRARLKYGYIENHESWDLISRIGEAPEDKICNILKVLSGLICLIANIIGILLILITKVWWSALIIIVFSLPLLYLAKKSGEKTYEANKNVTKYQRKYKYISDLIMGRESSQERTLFSYSEEMNKRWKEQYEIARDLTLDVEKNWYIKLELGSILTALISVISIVALLFPVVKGDITIGMFIALVNASFDLVEAMSWRMRRFVDELAKSRCYLQDLENFYAMEEVENITEIPVTAKGFNIIEFKNVSFRYPGTDKYVLNNMSFKMVAGQHYAFVGKNGKGKTTIIKLLTGLYDDYEGEILIDGKEIREYTADKLRGFYSVVYQDFVKYQIPLKDNILLGNINNWNDEIINNAIDLMSLEEVIDSLDKGIDTSLGRIASDAVDLSGGQWQKVAIARSIVSNAPIHILDEPTAALDPIAESQIYSDYEKISRGRTTLFISHRLGSTKLANEIFVVDNGKIKEQGSHEELMKVNGIYREMFDSQKEWYQ